MNGWIGGLMFLCVIFVPAFLLVVGVLLAALVDPVWPSAIHGRTEFAIALLAFAALVVARTSPLMVVAGAAIAGWLLL